MSPDDASPKSQSSVGTLKRGLSILQYIASAGEVTPATVASALNSSRSTTYRIVETLRGAGFLEANPTTGQLRLGIKAIEVGMAALADLDVINVAPAYLRELAANTLETVFLAVPNHDEMVYIFKEESVLPVRMNCKLGSRRPLHSTALGKAYMSALPDEDRTALIERLDLVRFTANTITDPQRLEADLAASRVRGYAFDNVEGEEGVSCLAAPVRDYSGLPIAAISVSGPTERITTRYTELGTRVADTATSLSRRLGYVSRDRGGRKRRD
jgi:DNA-binding IclR family transcriptional regulator